MAISKRGRIDIEVGMKGQAGVDKMSGGVGKLSVGITGLGKSMAGTVLKSGLLLAGISKLTGGIGGAIDTALTWNDWIGDNTKELEGMTKATAGIIKPLDLMKTRQQLLGAEIKATEGQMQALAKAAILNARINKSDLGPGLERMTKAILTGSDTAFRKLGIDAEFLGTKSEKTAQALAALETHFGDMVITAENVNEKMGQMGSAVQSAVGEMGNAILTSEFFQTRLSELKTTVEAITGFFREMARETKKLSTEQIDFSIGMITNLNLLNDALSIGGHGPLDAVTKQLAGLIPVYRKMKKQILKENKELQDAISSGPQQQFQTKTGPREAAKLAAKKKAAAQRAARAGAARRKQEDSDILGLVSPGKALVSKDETSAIIADLDREGLARRAQIADMRDAASAIHEMGAAYRAMHDPVAQAEREQAAFSLRVSDTGKEIGDMALGGLADLASGLFMAADAAILSGESMGTAMLIMLKQTMLSIGQQALVKSLFYAAEGVAASFTPGMQASAAGFFASSAMMAGVAGLAGGAGLAMSAAGVGATPTAKGAGAGAGADAGTGQRPSVGSGSGGGDMPDINIGVHLGPNTDPSASYHARQQIEADMERAFA